MVLTDNGIRLINCTGGDVRKYEGNPSQLPYGHAERLMQNRQPETKIFTGISPNNAISNSICSYNRPSTEQLRETNEKLKLIYDKEVGI